MTKTKRLKLDAILIQILKKDSFDCFTVIELRNEYLKCSNEELCSSETRKFVYKQILRMTNLGILTKKGSKNSQHATYKKTDLFDHVSLEENKKTLKLPSGQSIVTVNKHEEKSNSLNTLDKLLKEYQVDMISSIGESEEYIALCENYPEMKEHLKSKYHLARDRSSKLLGRIKAIETAITIKRSTL